MRVDLVDQCVLALVKGDITELAADAICNAANSALAGGGGVDGAIHRAAGPSLMAELDVIRRGQGGCPTGSAVTTSAGALPAQFVFHAVGPIFENGAHGEPELLASCYRTCLQLADERLLRHISFPSISTGVYGYPLSEAAPIALQAVYDHLSKGQSSVSEVTFVLFDDRTLRAYEQALQAKLAVGWKA